MVGLTLKKKNQIDILEIKNEISEINNWIDLKTN